MSVSVNPVNICYVLVQVAHFVWTAMKTTPLTFTQPHPPEHTSNEHFTRRNQDERCSICKLQEHAAATRLETHNIVGAYASAVRCSMDVQEC